MVFSFSVVSINEHLVSPIGFGNYNKCGPVDILDHIYTYVRLEWL
jgi:hypothetical protein